MLLMEIYVYDKATGRFLYKDTGHPSQATLLPDDKDFTLTAPPDNSKSWRWLDSVWQ